MKEFLVKIERVTKKSGPTEKISQRGDKYLSYGYDVEISAGDDMFIVSKFLSVKEGGSIEEVCKRESLFEGAIGTMKISSTIRTYTNKNGEPGRMESKRIESFVCYNKPEEADAQRMIDGAKAKAEAAAPAYSVPAQEANETVMGDGDALPF